MMQAGERGAMLGRLYEDQDCSAARALELIGERWSLLILRDAIFRGFTRFSEFQHALEIAPNILAKRLDNFVASGLMEARRQGEHSEHRDYRLTAKGQELKPVVMALSAWGAKWTRPGRMIYAHENCGGEVALRMRCTVCDATPDLSAVIVAPRPKAARTKDASSPLSERRRRR
jgi:DNA-binding HxlR family transcriptional regulator